MDGSADVADPDADLANNWQELMADTCPTNALSHFRITAVSNGPPVTVWFWSSSNRRYTLFSSPDLPIGPDASAIWTPVPGQADIPGTGALDTLRDTNAAPAKSYRFGVRMP